MDVTSKDSLCEACGVEIWTSGNYRIRIIPAKKMPKKALKLYHNLKKDERHHQWERSSFQKYILVRSKPKNTLEIRCGNCSAKTAIKMNKPAFVKPRPITPGSNLTTPLPTGSKSSRRNKPKKTPKDLNAGLIIPASMLTNSPSTPVTSLLQSTATSKISGHSSGGSGVGRFNPVNPSKKKAVQAEKQSKQKGMDNLKKVLYKSKQMGSSSSMNLQNFFGSS